MGLGYRKPNSYGIFTPNGFLLKNVKNNFTCVFAAKSKTALGVHRRRFFLFLKKVKLQKEHEEFARRFGGQKKRSVFINVIKMYKKHVIFVCFCKKCSKSDPCRDFTVAVGVLVRGVSHTAQKEKVTKNVSSGYMQHLQANMSLKKWWF